MSHRPSFNSGNNAYWSIDLNGEYCFDGERQPSRVVPAWVVEYTEYHEKNGSHPDCIHCRREADPRTPAQSAADADDAETRATHESARPY